ncbi:MAG: hypothetical protein COW30_01680 [Rhodospirillales bacterium CG15_BIG_FIL_POST_REV_8_21_14_020_66_15]|nr:MAG: hypothetical protein COW30_01680 [Rhodospirillales bacterium CG15_BIG_FIL_POST_REV_8_21_14_020_66_15]
MDVRKLTAGPCLASLAALAFAVSWAAAAQSQAPARQPAADAPKAAPAERKARISKTDCRWVLRHRPGADVAYAPGVDVRGKPVVPADVGGGPALDLPDVFEFTVTKDLSAFLDGPEERATAAKAAAQAAAANTSAADAAAVAAEEKASKSPKLELVVGTVSVDVKTGAMTFNGRPLNDAAMGDMVVLCREMLSGNKK